MSSKVFLQSLQSKLKGGNTRSIHLNALPGRLATRLDVSQFGKIEAGLSDKFLNLLLSEKNFSFKITYDGIDQNSMTKEELKKLGIITKRINSILIENDDYWKEHGVKTLGFGYPLLIKRSPKDPEKILAAPLFIWSFDIIRSTTKVNEWTILRNMTLSTSGKLVESEQHQITVNDVLHSFILGDEGIKLPTLTEDVLEDGVVDREELVDLCTEIINALNSGTKVTAADIREKLNAPIDNLPELSELKGYVNNEGFIHFGGVFGLYKTQKESIITDITKLLERFDEFEFENLQFDSVLTSNFSAITTDPSQQSIISSLGIENNQIIQGPPGTGKSQSLTALITNALSNNLKCLVVCEKKTALAVIKSNLEKADSKLSRLVAVIDDVNADREAIVDAVREGQNSVKILSNPEQTHYKYVELNRQLKSLKERINLGHQSLSTTLFSNESWSDLVGTYLGFSRVIGDSTFSHLFDKSEFSFDQDGSELKKFCSAIEQGKSIYLDNEKEIESFSVCSDELFNAYPITEGREMIERITTIAAREIPLLIGEIESELSYSTSWWYSLKESIPEAILIELANFGSYWTGLTGEVPTLPEYFVYEKEVIQLRDFILEYYKQAKDIREKYEKQLSTHYESYSKEFGECIEAFLANVEESEKIFGHKFYQNSSFSNMLVRNITRP